MTFFGSIYRLMWISGPRDVCFLKAFTEYIFISRKVIIVFSIIMITSLTNLFITVSDLEQTTSDWQKGIIIPIHKSASVYDLNNFRGITLTSNVYKLYASIMENTIMTFLEIKMYSVKQDHLRLWTDL
jgi:hypothetical protein